MDIISRLMHRLLLQTEQYPLTVRLAARFLIEGGTEETWIEMSKRPKFQQFPLPLMNAIHNAIRDINHGILRLADIPDIET